MKVYIVVYESAYGQVIDSVYTNRKKAEDYIKSLKDTIYCYEIIEEFAI